MKCWLACLLLLASCTPLPRTYAVPEQRPAADGPDPEPMGAMVTFGNFRRQEHIVGGILDAAPDQTWRWTNDQPQVRVRIGTVDDLKLRVKFALPDASHTKLLPISISYYVNDHLLEKVAYRKTGELTYEKPVPAEWLVKGGENVIRMVIDPVYIAEADKAKLGMILSEAGFEVAK